VLAASVRVLVAVVTHPAAPTDDGGAVNVGEVDDTDHRAQAVGVVEQRPAAGDLRDCRACIPVLLERGESLRRVDGDGAAVVAGDVADAVLSRRG